MRKFFNLSYLASSPVFRMLFTVIAAFTVSFLTGPRDVWADPAFLAPGTTPNLLIIMDNSKSMLDLAYLPDNGACHDSIDLAETEAAGHVGYDRATTYAGYFSSNAWYAYNAARARFERISRPLSCIGIENSAFTHVRGGIEELCLQPHNTSLEFKSRGNLLNWATASRFDIQKKVLTGGKFNHQERTLISQGRGCPGTRFIRQIRIWNVATDTAHVLSLGIRAMDPDPDPDHNQDQDQTTVVEVFSPRLAGFDNSVCQSFFDTMPSSADNLDSLNDLMAGCLENSALPFVLPKASDPSLRLPIKGDRINLPSLLTDILTEQQLGPPLQVMQGVIYDPLYANESPRGILHESVGKLRVGLMRFNHDGSRSECSLFDHSSPDNTFFDFAENDCSGNSLDAGRVIVEIDDGTPDHIDQMVDMVNAANADAWSPLAEAVFAAIGYYTQRDDLRINPSDFPLDAAPCTHWCQGNNILVITDGASTVDLHPGMTTFASVEGQNDGSRDSMDGCSGLLGSTFLDDITAYGFSGNNIHLENPFDADEHFQNIKTYFVVAGNLSARGEGECSPASLLAEAAAHGGSKAPYFADNPQDLEDELKSALNMIRSGGYAGPSASVFSAGPNGGGAVYRSRFWSAMEALPNTPADRQVTWTGDVNAFLMDADGRLYEDTDGNGALNILDEQVSIYLDTEANDPRACSQEPEADGTCAGSVKTLDQIHHLWSTAEWLAGIADADVNANREHYISDTKKRYIFTWNDLDNNGAVAEDELLPFVPLDDWCSPSLSVAADRAPIPIDFGAHTTEEVNDIISWIRGQDSPMDPSRRSRQVPLPPNFKLDNDPETITWRLGDVIHSTPTVVADPGENYHLLYNDDEYAAFAAANLHRRHVIYFGGNDGMVHAVNGGFYDADRQKFWRSYDRDTGLFSDTGPGLGAELWAYVPYNLLPHLQRLTRTDYRHTYYVDLTPRVFDVQIFDSSPESLGHVHGWGTIMLVGMRLGGDRISAREIIAKTPSTACEDDRVFTSAFMVFDITDPENSPRLLGEMTYQPQDNADLGYTTAMPAVVPIKSNENGSDWFLVLGSGPTDATGVSHQNARVCIFPLAELDAGQAFRIPAATVYSHASAGSFNLVNAPHGFVSGMTVADYHLDDLYQADALYFGTIEGTWGDWGGRVYRWITNEGFPQNWDNPVVMIDAERPVTSPPVIGFDGNFHWIYFGTGRFFDVRDKIDAGSNDQDYFFGLKEPVDTETGAFTWSPIENRVSMSKPQPGNDAGARSLLRVDQIEVKEAYSPSLARLSCRDGSMCLPDGVSNFKDLYTYIVGRCDSGVGCTGADGWVRAFETPWERNLGQGTLLGGLISFTTYQPFQDICQPAGQSFFYNLHFQTGTPYYASVIDASTNGTMAENDQGSLRTIMSRLPIGKGLATTPRLFAGRQQGSKALIQTTAGAFLEITQSNLPVKTIKSGRLNWRSD